MTIRTISSERLIDWAKVSNLPDDTITELVWKEDKSNKGVPLGYASLGSDWYLEVSQLPPLAGAGDMTKSVYDPNNDGIVTQADTITSQWDLATLDTVGTAQIDNHAVTNAELAQMNANTVKGRQSGNGTPQDIAMADLPISTVTQTALDWKANLTGGNVFSGNNTFNDVVDIVKWNWGNYTDNNILTDCNNANKNWFYWVIPSTANNPFWDYANLLVLADNSAYARQIIYKADDSWKRYIRSKNAGTWGTFKPYWTDTSAWTSWTPSWTYVTWTTYAKYKVIWKTAHILAHFSVSWVPIFEFNFGGLPFSILGWTTCVWMARVRQTSTLHTASYELTWSWWYVSMHSPQNTFSWLTGTWQIQFSATYEIA